jgi:hypothetical protein
VKKPVLKRLARSAPSRADVNCSFVRSSRLSADFNSSVRARTCVSSPMAVWNME